MSSLPFFLSLSSAIRGWISGGGDRRGFPTVPKAEAGEHMGILPLQLLGTGLRNKEGLVLPLMCARTWRSCLDHVSGHAVGRRRRKGGFCLQNAICAAGRAGGWLVAADRHCSVSWASPKTRGNLAWQCMERRLRREFLEPLHQF